MRLHPSRARLLVLTACACAALLPAQQDAPQNGTPGVIGPTPVTAKASDPGGPIASDRPGFSDGVNIVPTGYLQYESGYTLSLSSTRKLVRAATASLLPDAEIFEVERNIFNGAPLVRLGVSRRVELRFGGDGFLDHSHRIGALSHYASGFSDFFIGAKIALAAESRRRPALTFISALSLPVGSSKFSSAGLDPTVKLAWAKTLSHEITLSGNFNAGLLTDSGERFWNKAASIQISRSLWRELSGFAEVYAILPQGGERIWTFDAGLAHSLGRHTQVDLSFGQQVVPMARCWFVSGGIVVRGSLLGIGRRRGA